MDSKVEVKADFIIDQCKRRGVALLKECYTEPLDFITICNEKGDMAAVSKNNITYEPAMYVPEWSEKIKNWAEAEGFDQEKIDKQNLIRHVDCLEAIDYLCS
jgi:hypothetical protein